MIPPRRLRFWGLHMHCVSLLHLHSLSRYASRNEYHCAILSLALTEAASLASKPGNSHFPFPRPLTHVFISLQCWQTSEAKEPKNCWWEFMTDAPAPWSRAGVPSKWDNWGIVAVFLPQDGAQCRLQSISRKLDEYSSIFLSLMSILLLLHCYQRPCWWLKNII